MFLLVCRTILVYVCYKIVIVIVIFIFLFDRKRNIKQSIRSVCVKYLVKENDFLSIAAQIKSRSSFLVNFFFFVG